MYSELSKHKWAWVAIGVAKIMLILATLIAMLCYVQAVYHLPPAVPNQSVASCSDGLAERMAGTL